MGKGTRFTIVCASVLLCINAVLVVFRPASRESPANLRPMVEDTTNATFTHEVTGVASSASCSCNQQDSTDLQVTPRPRPTVNYSLLAAATPRVYLVTNSSSTLSRLGNQLKLNYAQKCPKGSVMLNNEWRHYTPDHLDCPTLFIVGARKAGTTSLYTYLSRHPNFKGIFLDRGPMAGETFYFSAHHDKDSWDWRRYTKLFEHVTWLMTGDSSVGNLVNCNVPERIWRACGKQAKIVILLRDPLRRFLSNYLMRSDQGIRSYSNNTRASTVVEVELESFINTALKKGADIRSIDQSWERFRCLFSPSRNLLFEGLYYVHVMNWLCNFPPENILILNSEEFFEKTPTILEQVIEFLALSPLDIDTVEFITSTVYNQGSGFTHSHQHLSDLDRRKLMAIYKHTNKPLLQLLDWQNVNWNW